MNGRKSDQSVATDLSTAAMLIGADRTALIDKLHEEGVLTYNARKDNIARSMYINLGHFRNELRAFSKKTTGTTSHVYELVTVTHWGMEFLRKFCEDHNIPIAKQQRRQSKPIKKAKPNSEGMRAAHDIAASL